jgi:prepilin-type N-terminal cleavage/methylation domain-containing protein
MKMKNKLSKGMTLVEVMVSMVIFAIVASATLTVISNANKLSNRSKMRDSDLADQTAIIGKKADDQLQDLTPSGKSYFMQFIPAGGSTVKAPDYGLYQADEASFGNEFGFQLKTIQPTTGLNALTTSNSGQDEYLYSFKNEYFESVTIKVTVNNGYIYEGVRGGNAYTHTAETYTRTVRAGETAIFGYYNPSFNSSSDIKISVKTASYAGANLSTGSGASFNATVRRANYVFSSTGGTNPLLTVAGPTYPTS